MSRSKGKNSKVRKENDFYKTPQWCIDGMGKSLCAEYPWSELCQYKDLWLYDLGAGDGRIGHTIFPQFSKFLEQSGGKTHEFYIDIKRDVYLTGNWIVDDYTKEHVKPETEHAPTVYVSNPPFSASEAFVYKTVEDLAGRDISMAVFLLRLNWLGSKHRAAWINAHPPCKVLVLAPRPSFNKVVRIDKDGKKRTSNTDACEYGWFFWSSNYTSKKPFEVYDLSP